jgi:hypothetical protein
MKTTYCLSYKDYPSLLTLISGNVRLVTTLQETAGHHVSITIVLLLPLGCSTYVLRNFSPFSYRYIHRRATLHDGPILITAGLQQPAGLHHVYGGGPRGPRPDLLRRRQPCGCGKKLKNVGNPRGHLSTGLKTSDAEGYGRGLRTSKNSGMKTGLIISG